MPRLLRIFLILWVVMPGIAGEAAGLRPLSLDECIQLALRNNYDLRIERLNPEIARYNLSGADGAYEPVFTFRAGEQLLTVPGGIDPKKSGIDSPYELTTDSVGMGVSGVLPTGLQYGIQATSSRLKELTDFGAVPGFLFLYPPYGIRNTNQYTSTAAITLQQPLLRDLWIDKYRQTILVSQKNLKTTEMGLRWRMMNLVYAVQQAYYELVYAREKVQVDEQAVHLADQLVLGIRRQVEVGKTPALEIQQASSQLETARTTSFASQQALARQRNVLKNLISDDFRSGAGVNIDPSETLVTVPYVSDRIESWRTALDRRPDLTELRIDLEKQGIIVRYRFNQLFPSLDLVGGYGLQSQENSSESSLADIRDRSKPQYGFGLVLSIPLSGNQAARNSYKASQAAKQQAVLQLKKMEQNVLVQVDDSLNQVQSAFHRTESARQARQYAEMALTGEQQKLADGVSTAFFVLQYQQKLTEAHTIEIRALADYNLALAQLALSEGRTLEKNHIQLQLK